MVNFTLDGITWRCFLGACRVTEDIPRAERVYSRALKQDPNSTTLRVLMSNMYPYIYIYIIANLYL